MEIKWNKVAVKQLLQTIEYLEENELFDYAQKIEKTILFKVRALSENADIYQLDRLKKNNDGTYKALEVDRYRISFRKLDKEIRILRIRHTARKPVR